MGNIQKEYDREPYIREVMAIRGCSKEEAIKYLDEPIVDNLPF